MNVKKILLKKISLWTLFLTIFISLIISILFGSAVLRSKTALKIAMLPKVIKNLFIDDFNVVVNSKRFKNKTGFNYYSEPSENLHLLLSRYDGDLGYFVIELINLNKKKIVYKWKPKIKKIKSFSENKLIKYNKFWISNPFMLNDGSILVHGVHTPFF